MTDKDERFSITVALSLMLVLTVIAAVGIVFEFNPFSLGFNAAFVFLPTLGLLTWFTWTRSKKNLG